MVLSVSLSFRNSSEVMLEVFGNCCLLSSSDGKLELCENSEYLNKC